MSGIPNGAPGTTFSTDLTGVPADAAVEAGIRALPSRDMVSALTATGIEETPETGNPGFSTFTATRARPSVVSEPDADGPRYQIVFTVDGVENATEDFWVSGTAPVEGLTPDLAEVAARIRERTRGTDEVGGRLLGTFTADTSPTASQVEDLIADAVGDVRTELGPALDTTDDAGLIDRARRLAAVRAAMLVELSFFREQTVGDDTAYGRLKEMWDEGIGAMRDALRSDPGDAQDFDSLVAASPTNTAHMGALAGVDPWLP